MSKDINFKADDYTFSVRTVGVTVRDGKVLLQREKDGNEYALPGGTIKLGETSQETLMREYKDIIIYPTFLKDEIHNWNSEIKHFISKE